MSSLEHLEALLSSWKASDPSPALAAGRPVTTVEQLEAETMKRTPQPALTQSRLTGSGMLKIQGAAPSQPADKPCTVGQVRDRSFSEGDSMASAETFKSPERSQNMDTSTPNLTKKRPRSDEGDDNMKQFFLQALKINREEIIQSFQANLGEMAGKVEANTVAITMNKENIQKVKETSDRHDKELERLTARVKMLETKHIPRKPAVPVRAVLSEPYLKARRSLRIWPVDGTTEEEIWGNAGEFLHGPLAIPEGDVGQDDVEDVSRVQDPLQPENIRNEVVVRFKDRKTRDMVMASSVNLASCTDSAGRPTAGTRLELPEELKDTFRLLARFGTRLRARHGEGTKRHVKFDDYAGSLFLNIKLPGDTKWTRVTPEMARADLDASLREEDEANQKRLAAKLIPGPRERLQRPPLAAERLPLQARSQAAVTDSRVSQAPPSGKRPRWAGPSRGPT